MRDEVAQRVAAILEIDPTDPNVQDLLWSVISIMGDLDMRPDAHATSSYLDLSDADLRALVNEAKAAVLEAKESM